LLTVNSSDNKEFGFDTFRADLEPPVINWTYTFRNGFRTDKIENVTIKPVDSINPVLFCNLTANDAFYNFSTNNNTQVTRQFNLTFDNNIKVTCWDLLNHTKTESKYFFAYVYNFTLIDEKETNYLMLLSFK
jgi:hypothetical protein